MAENELQELINGIFSRIKEKYGYTDEQALIYLQGCQDCAEENQKSLEKRDKILRDTVAELVEAKRLLKSAVEDNKRVLRENFGDICLFCKHYSNSEAQCRKPHNGSGSWCCENAEWRYAAEALKLIES